MELKMTRCQGPPERGDRLIDMAIWIVTNFDEEVGKFLKNWQAYCILKYRPDNISSVLLLNHPVVWAQPDDLSPPNG
jgi:hypothetical protein